MSFKDLDPFNYIDIKPQNYKSKQQLVSDLEEISKNLENITNDWKEREISLQKIGSITKGNLSQSDIFIKYFNTKLCNFLEIQLSDLRSSVMKEACRITSLCAGELELLIEQGITQLLSQNCLCKIAGSANKVIADSASKCILNIVRYVHSLKVISNICEMKTMKANNVRILCAQCLVNIISYYDNHFIIKSKEILEETIKSLLVDANAEVRSTTRKAFILYKSRFEEDAENLFNELGKNVQKQINEDEKTFDNNFKVKIKNEKNEKYLKSISKEIDDNINKINCMENIQNKPKTPEFNLFKKKNSNDFNKKENNNKNSNKNNVIKKTKSNKKSVTKNNKNNNIIEEKEETVKYINVDDDDVADNETGYIDLNDNEEEKTSNKDPTENSENDTNNKNHINKEDSKEINAVFNYSNKPTKKIENKNNTKIVFNKKNINQNKKFETAINKLNNPNKLQKENNTENKLIESQNFNNFFDINNKNNLNTYNSNNKNEINDFNIDELINNNNKDCNNSNNNKKNKKIIINNNTKITKTKSNITSERTNSLDNSPNNTNNTNKTKTKNKQKNDNMDNTNKNQQILKKLNTKFEQLESGVVVSGGGKPVQKNNYLNEKKRGKSKEKEGIKNYEYNKSKTLKKNVKKDNENNLAKNNNILKNYKTKNSALYKSTNINSDLIINNLNMEEVDNDNDNKNKRKILSNKQIKVKETKNNNINDEENDIEEELDTVIDIDIDKKKEKNINNNSKKRVNLNNNVTNKEKINPKTNTYHFSKSNNKSNKTISSSIISENYINNALNNNNINNNINNKSEENILNKESIEDKINAIIDKLDNIMNQNEKIILFQYLFNHFNATLQDIKNFSPNTIKRYINIHIENLKENDKNLIEQIIKNLMRMIFYMNYIFNTYEIESILKLLLFSLNDINDKTLIKLNNQLLEIIKKKCDNEELFKSVYGLLAEYNTNYDNCYDFMYLLIPECGNILNNNNYFKQVFRLICLTDNTSKKVGKIIDILYRKYSNNFNQAYEEETLENKNKILMFMEKTNSLYFREFKSSHENIDNMNKNLNNKLNDKNNNVNNNNTTTQIKIENEISNNDIDNKENTNNKLNNVNNKSGNIYNNINSKNNIIYNQSNKNGNNINTINTNLNGNNIISINNSNNNNIIITNKLPDESIPNDIKLSIQNNNLEQYISYMEEHKSYIPEFILLLSNKKYNDENSVTTLLNFTKNLLSSNNFSIDLNACINLMVKQLIYILTSHKNNEKIIELIKNILSNMPLYLNADKTLSSIAKFLNIDNESIVLETLLISIQNFIINNKSKKKLKVENNDNKNLENLLNCFINEVFNLLKHQNSEIRKRAVYCCVEIHLVMGKEFENYLGKIPKNQQNLIKLYLKKRTG